MATQKPDNELLSEIASALNALNTVIIETSKITNTKLEQIREILVDVQKNTKLAANSVATNQQKMFEKLESIVKTD